MAFVQEALPYAVSALEPHMSAKTFEFHYGKHHAAYVTNLSNLTKDTPMADMSLEEVIKASFGDASKAGIFNNAAQVWNHTFFWKSMKPNGGGAPTGELAAKIDAAFGSFDQFKTDFKTAIELIKQNTRRFAKRQLTWFNHQGDFESFEPTDLEKIKAFIDVVIQHL